MARILILFLKHVISVGESVVGVIDWSKMLCKVAFEENVFNGMERLLS